VPVRDHGRRIDDACGIVIHICDANLFVFHHLRRDGQRDVRWQFRDALVHHLFSGKLANILAVVRADQFFVPDNSHALAFVAEHDHFFRVIFDQEAGNVHDGSAGFAGRHADGHEVADEGVCHSIYLRELYSSWLISKSVDGSEFDNSKYKGVSGNDFPRGT